MNIPTAAPEAAAAPGDAATPLDGLPTASRGQQGPSPEDEGTAEGLAGATWQGAALGIGPRGTQASAGQPASHPELGQAPPRGPAADASAREASPLPHVRTQEQNGPTEGVSAQRALAKERPQRPSGAATPAHGAKDLKRKRRDAPLLALLPEPLAARPPSQPALRALAAGVDGAPEAPAELPRLADGCSPLEELPSTKRWARPLLASALSAVLGILQVSGSVTNNPSF